MKNAGPLMIGADLGGARRAHAPYEELHSMKAKGEGGGGEERRKEEEKREKGWRWSEPP